MVWLPEGTYCFWDSDSYKYISDMEFWAGWGFILIIIIKLADNFAQDLRFSDVWPLKEIYTISAQISWICILPDFILSFYNTWSQLASQFFCVDKRYLSF